jgi:dihydroneopterin aldolase
VVDATLHCDLRKAGESDDLQHTVNYAAVHEWAPPPGRSRAPAAPRA